MDIWGILAIILGLICVSSAIVGAVTSKEGTVGVVANLSIPLFFAVCAGILVMPPLPGFDPLEILSCVVLVVAAILMTESNRRHHNVIIKNMEQGKY